MCEPHGWAAATACEYCVWADSADPVKIRAATRRADRVAGRPTPPPPSPAAAAATTPDLAAVVRAAMACPARYRVSCGCAEPFRCVLRFGGGVTLDDCRRCLQTTTPRE